MSLHEPNLVSLRIVIFVLGLCLCSNVNASYTSDKQIMFVVSGVIVNSGSANLLARFTQLIGDYLNIEVKLKFASSYDELNNILRDNPNSLGWNCGAPFVRGQQEYGQKLVSVPLFLNKPTYHSLVITRVNKSEKDLADFNGKVIAYSDPVSNSGYISPAIDLKRQGKNIKSHFRLLLHTGNHERSIKAVVNGLADVAAVDEYVWVEVLKANSKLSKKLKVIDKYGPYPFTPIVSGNAVSAELISKLREMLHKLPLTEVGKKILAEFGLDGFVTKSHEFYAPIEKMMAELNM